MDSVHSFSALPVKAWELIRRVPLPLLLLLLIATTVGIAVSAYLILFIVAPIPRAPTHPEKTYQTILPDGAISEHKQLPCWIDTWRARKELAKRRKDKRSAGAVEHETIDDAELLVTVVVPAYNEQDRLPGMLEEATAFLQSEYGDAHGTPGKNIGRGSPKPNGKVPANGWEILIISDGSVDKTAQVALDFAKEHQLALYPKPNPGPWKTPNPAHIPHGSIRVVQLEQNRGKGGAVVHGMRHARGQYIIFADADGASNFENLADLLRGAQSVEDKWGRAVAIGSRAHLVGSEAVVKRSRLRNFLMHSFHILLRLMTPPATSAIRDTQCGFKLFTRPSLPYIIPYMHSERWIFDVEMLMLAESAKIPMTEVAIGWKEVMGSKLNVIKDSINMAWDLAILRAAWIAGVYKRS